MEVNDSTTIGRFEKERKCILEGILEIVSLRLVLCSGKDIRETNVATIRKMLHDPCHSTELVFERGSQDKKGDGRVDVDTGKEAGPSSSLQKASRKRSAHNLFGI